MTLWGGRFDDALDDSVWALTASRTDRRLLAVDVAGSVAHVTALGSAGILPSKEVTEILTGLESIAAEVAAGGFEFTETDEDVHTAVERRLIELIGSVGGKLHTGRSRNDQIALDIRLYLLDSVVRLRTGIAGLMGALVDVADRSGETVVPSYTHLQHAQAVPFAHHLLAHAWALSRDRGRFDDLVGRLKVSPLGAGAGGGSRLPLEPEVSAAHLGFDAVFTNSLDAVSSRDQAIEYAWCCTQTFVDLSRLAEEVVLWSSSEFSWMTLADRHSTGSSALPQKRNPDPAELIRGKAGSAIGRLTGLLSMMKALPLSYNRDMQEDKEHLFVLGDDLEHALAAMAGLIAGAAYHPNSPSGDVTALDLAEVLVERGVPFREAHEAVGRLVAARNSEGNTLQGAGFDELAAVHDAFQPGDQSLTDPTESVRARRSPGGGSFESVRVQIAALKTELELRS
ncbi:MAG: argininosuccinate lyase [Acidobacteria bacterium]|nr:argininosuccinate lyase [Acidobacteriota bacterium]